MADKKVGVQFVAEGSEKVAEEFARQEKLAEQYNTGLLRLAETTARGAINAGELARAEQLLYDALTDSTASVIEQQRALNMLEQVERKQLEAASQAQAAEAARIELSNKLIQVLQARVEALYQLAQAEEQAQKASQGAAGGTGAAVGGTDFALVEKQVEQVLRNIQFAVTAAHEFGQGAKVAAINWEEVGEAVKEALGGDPVALAQLQELERVVSGIGANAQQSFEQARKASEQLGASTLGAAKSFETLQQQVQETTGATTQLEQANEGAAASSEKAGNSAREMGQKFFALTLLSFGLMEIERQLEKAFGDELPQAFSQTISSIQIIASFGSAGAFLGPVGAGIGLITGAVLALTTAILATDPAIQQLNQSLDQMSKKDELQQTLATTLGVSEELAAKFLEAARADAEFAASLEEVTRAAEPVAPILASFREASDELAGSADFLGDVLDALSYSIQAVAAFALGGGVAFVKFAQALIEGKNIVDAYAEGQRAGTETFLAAGRAAEGQIPTQEKLNELERRATEILREKSNAQDQAARAAHTYAEALEAAAFREEQLGARTGQQYLQAQQQFSNSVMDAAEQRATAIANAETQLSNRLQDVWTDLSDRIVDINQTLANRVADIHAQLSNRLAEIDLQLGNRTLDIQQTLANKTADIQQQLADKVAQIQNQLADRVTGIQQDLSNKLAQIDQDLANKQQDLQRQYQLAIQQANQKIEDAARDLSRKLFEIERQRLQDTARLGFDTAEQLRLANTDRDRDDIRRRAQFEKGQIDQRANNARTDAQADFADKVAQTEREKALAREQYEYELALARQLAAQKIAQAQAIASQQIAQAQRAAAGQIAQAQHAAAVDLAIAQRTAVQQLEQAQRQAAQQRELAERNAAQQLALAQREAAQQRALAERRYAEEVAQAQRAYAQQVEAARQAEIQKASDAARALEQRNQAIAASYALELAAIEESRKNAHEAYEYRIKLLEAELKAVTMVLQAYSQLGSAVPTFNDPNIQVGGDNPGFTITQRPPATPYPPVEERAPFIPTTTRGERTIITPPARTTTNTSRVYNFVINDATDPHRVMNVVREALSNEAWR